MGCATLNWGYVSVTVIFVITIICLLLLLLLLLLPSWLHYSAYSSMNCLLICYSDNFLYWIQVKSEGGLNASASFVAKANPLNRAPHKRKSELHHALCNMLSSILGPLADGGKNLWPPSGVDPALTLWYDAVSRIRGQLTHWMEKQSKHLAVSGT